MKRTEESEKSIIENKNARKEMKHHFQCEICTQKFRYLAALKKHKIRHEGTGGFICKICNRSFTTSEAREKHRDKEHKLLRCKICKLRFTKQTDFLRHVNTLHEGRDCELSVCSECGKQFRTKGELSHHIQSKCGTIKLYKCTVCYKTLMTPGSLHNHMLRHTGQLSFMCRFCAKTFLTAGQLTVHERMHTKEKAFVCEICNKGFCHRQSLITHSTLHTGIKPYQCENCSNAFSCVGNLLKHRKTHADTCGLLPLTSHRVKNPTTKLKVQVNTPASSKLKTIEKRKRIEEIINNNSSESFEVQANDNEINEHVEEEEEEVCSEALEHLPLETEMYDDDDKSENLIPDLRLENDKELDDNEEENGNVDYFKEWSTKNGSLSDDSLDLETRRGRKRKKFKRKSKKRDKNKNLECKYCGTRYSLVRWLIKHESKHEREMNGCVEETYKCSCCNLTFSSKFECSNHQLQMHTEQLKCKQCDRTFANPDSIKAHLNFYHKGVPQKKYVYVCDKCGKMFNQKAVLVSHKENNCIDARLYPCELCNKSFTSKHVRRSHMRIHIPEKLLLCKHCGKSFRWKGQLKIHERSHTGERPFCCDFCQKRFCYRESLVTHLTLHTGIKPHLCEACGSRFSCIGNLVKHRRARAYTCGLAMGVKPET